ncbi:MAG TPA: hypothetical protein VFT82_00595, partial [Candidatus Paceibacterota bacterium]|nr:hypothetical protein [Candidatus Paceibacterota bacterium]
MTTSKKTWNARITAMVALFFTFVFIMVVYYDRKQVITYIAPPPLPETVDFFAYNKKMIEMANYGTTSVATGISATSTLWTATTTSISSPKNLWPVSTVYPKYGAILPFNRIVAYYGNLSSTALGALGRDPIPKMLDGLQKTVEAWQAADPSTPVIPAFDYIVVIAQAGAGPDGKYRLRMSDEEIQKAIDLVDSIHGLIFLDIQPGLSNVETEVPLLEKFLEKPNVELAIDPEFSMKTGAKPGTIIGTMSADDVNFSANYLARIVRRKNLPPKILLVHRFTENMVTGVKDIKTLEEVQIVMNMDGWGAPSIKKKVYSDV